MKKKSTLKGIIGVFLSVSIGFIPWIIYYLIVDESFSAYGILIPIFAYKGYQFFNGKDNENQLIVYVFVSTILSLINCFITMPLLYLNKNVGDVSPEGIIDTLKWIEVHDELLHNYLYLMAFIIIGLSILFTIYIPYKTAQEEEEKIRARLEKGEFINFSTEDYAKTKLKYNKKFTKPIIISILIVALSILLVVPKKDRVKLIEGSDNKLVTNGYFSYNIPNEYYVYKYSYDLCVVRKLTDEDEHVNGVTVTINTIKEENNTLDSLFDILNKNINLSIEENSSEAKLRYTKKVNKSSNEHPYIEIAIDNFNGATHIIRYIIDDNFEYCATIECTCFDGDEEVLSCFDLMIRSLEFK